MTVAFDAASHSPVSSYSPSGAAQTLTFAHTVGTGTNRLLAVMPQWTARTPTMSISAITYNGVPLTHGALDGFASEFDEFANETRTQNEMWFLRDPSSGTHDVVITFTCNNFFGVDILAGAASFTGVKHTGSFVATSDTRGALNDGAPTAAPVLSPVNGLVIGGFSGKGFVAGTLTPHDTEMWSVADTTFTGHGGGGAYAPGNGGTVAIDWTTDALTAWGASAVGIVAEPPPAPVLMGQVFL